MPILGDDQIVVDGSGACASCPRRMRFYSTCRSRLRAPTARFPSPCADLARRKPVHRMTRGFVAPSIRIAARRFGPPSPRGFLPIGRTVLIGRMPAGNERDVLSIQAPEAVDQAMRILEEERAKHRSVPGCEGLLRAAENAERATSLATLAAGAVSRVGVRARWHAPRAIGALAAEPGTP